MSARSLRDDDGDGADVVKEDGSYVGDGGGIDGGGGSDGGDVVSHALSAVDEVAERVLSFLPAKSLLACATVCRLWSCTVRRILRHRQRIEWAAVGEASPNEHPSQHALLPCLEEHLKTVWCVPRVALYFADAETFLTVERSITHGRKRAKLERGLRLAEQVEAMLPSRCSVVGLAVPGVILTPGGPSSLPMEVEEGPAGACLLLPEMDGVSVRVACLQPSDCHGNLEQRLHQAGLLGDPELRVVLLLCHRASSIAVWTFCRQILELLEPQSAVLAGGKVHSLLSPSPLMAGGGGAVCVSFSGANVQAASVLLDTAVASPEAARAALRRLAIPALPVPSSAAAATATTTATTTTTTSPGATTAPQPQPPAPRAYDGRTLGLMFACVGRGSYHYGGRPGVEARAFRETFPGTPLVGFFGEGEIGCDRICTGRYSLRHVAPRGDGGGGGVAALIHGYTSVFTLLHLGSASGGVNAVGGCV